VPAANMSILVSYDVKSYFDTISIILLNILQLLISVVLTQNKQDLSLVTLGALTCGGLGASPICSFIDQTLQSSPQVYNHPTSCSWLWLCTIRSPCTQKWPYAL